MCPLNCFKFIPKKKFVSKLVGLLLLVLNFTEKYIFKPPLNKYLIAMITNILAQHIKTAFQSM